MSRSRTYAIALSLFITFGMLLAACVGQRPATSSTTSLVTEEAEPAATGSPASKPDPTDTSEPTGTPTATCTATAESTSTPTAVPTDAPAPTPTEVSLILGDPIEVETGGFTFQPVTWLSVDLSQYQAVAYTEDKEVIVFLAGKPDEAGKPLDVIIDDFVKVMGEGTGEMLASEPLPYSIDGIEGLAVEVAGPFMGEAMNGKVAAVVPQEGRTFLAYGLGLKGRWVEEGSSMFDAMIETVSFVEEMPAETKEEEAEGISDFPLPLPSGAPASEWQGMPVMTQAIAGNEGQGDYYYTVEATVNEVLDYYEIEMGNLGWTMLGVGEGQTGTLIMIFEKAGAVASVAILPLDDTTTYVFLVSD